MASPVRLYFYLAFALTWGIGGIGLLVGHWVPSAGLSTSTTFYYIAAYSVSISGFAFTAKYDGTAGLRRLIQRLIPWRSPLHVYLIVIAGYVAITALA